MRYGASLHQALSETLRYLDVDELIPLLDQMVADTSEDENSASVVGQTLSRIGLLVHRVSEEHIQTAATPRQAVLGVGTDRYVLVERAGRGKLQLTMLDDQSGRQTSRVRKVPHMEGMTWFVVRREGALSSLANPGKSLRPWERLFKLVRLEQRDITTVAVYAATLGALSLVTPIATQALVNTIAFGAMLQPLVILILALSVGLGLATILTVAQAYLVEVFQRRILVRAAEDLGRRFPRVATCKSDRSNLIELNNRFLDIITIQKSAAELLLTGSALVIQMVIGFVLLGLYHPLLLGFDLILMAGLITVTLLGRGGTGSAVIESRAKFALAEWLDELARNPHRFRGGHGRVLAEQELSHRAHTYVKSRRRHYRRVFAVLLGGNVIKALALVGLLALGGWLVIERQLTLGQLVAAELVVGTIAVGIGKMGQLADKTFDLVAALDKLGKLLDLPLEAEGTEALPDAANGLPLDVEGLKVGYGEDSELPTHLSFSLSAGEKALLTGKAGSGKSAVIETLAGWRPPRAGRIVWDRHQRPNSDDRALAVWAVCSDSLMAGSVMSNLRLADASLSTAAAWEALEQVGLRDTVEKLPKGLETRLLPEGGPLSPCQVRRLKLAQALIARPRLMLIDEMLDDLGNDSEQVIERVIGQDNPWTAVVVSGDPSVQRRLHRRIDTEAVAGVGEAQS